MIEGLYQPRRCRKCGKRFQPRYANEHVHPECRPAWYRKYHRDYQRRARREIKRSFEDWDANQV